MSNYNGNEIEIMKIYIAITSLHMKIKILPTFESVTPALVLSSESTVKSKPKSDPHGKNPIFFCYCGWITMGKIHSLLICD